MQTIFTLKIFFKREKKIKLKGRKQSSEMWKPSGGLVFFIFWIYCLMTMMRCFYANLNTFFTSTLLGFACHSQFFLLPLDTHLYTDMVMMTGNGGSSLNFFYYLPTSLLLWTFTLFFFSGYFFLFERFFKKILVNKLSSAEKKETMVLWEKNSSGCSQLPLLHFL